MLRRELWEGRPKHQPPPSCLTSGWRVARVTGLRLGINGRVRLRSWALSPQARDAGGQVCCGSQTPAVIPENLRLISSWALAVWTNHLPLDSRGLARVVRPAAQASVSHQGAEARRLMLAITVADRWHSRQLPWTPHSPEHCSQGSPCLWSLHRTWFTLEPRASP